MKKLLFSAIALVAFSGVSMANTVNQEKGQKIENAFSMSNCDLLYDLAYNLAIS